MKKRLLWSITLVLLLSLGVCTFAAQVNWARNLPVVTVASATSGILEDSYHGTATVTGQALAIELPEAVGANYAVGCPAVLRYTDENGQECTAASTLTSREFDPAAAVYRGTLTLPEGAILADGRSVAVRLVRKSAYYDNIIPSESVQEDMTGAYVLVLRTRDGVFGQERYVERCAVTILDRSVTAVAVETWNFADRVVVSSTKYVTDGDVVSL